MALLSAARTTSNAFWNTAEFDQSARVLAQTAQAGELAITRAIPSNLRRLGNKKTRLSAQARAGFQLKPDRKIKRAFGLFFQVQIAFKRSKEC